jgi:osmotically-inducible protein OsmY
MLACDKPSDDVATTRNDVQAVAPDNAKKNERDRNDNAPTPGDQGNSDRDIEITRQIREQVVAHPNFSINAQNVKIITQNGAVTLRGPVETAEEKATIERIAKAQAGANKVVSELEVKVEDDNGKE